MRKTAFSAVLALLPFLAAGVASAQSTLISSRTFNGPGGSHDVFYAAKAAPGGGYYLAGYTSSTATGADIWVLKVDAGLNVVSSATFNGSANGFDTAYGIGLSSAGDVYVVGASSNTGIGMVWWLGRYDSNLVRLASATYTFGFSDTNTSCDSVFVKADGTVIAMGDIYTSASASGSRVWTVRFSPNFNIQATFGYSAGFGPEYADSMHVTPSGEYYKFGALAPAALTSTNLFIARTDSSDVGISTVIVAGAGGNTDQARGGALGSNGDLYVTGIMNNAGLYTDAWLARYTPTLTFVSSRNVAGSATNHHQGNDLAQGPAGTFVVTGALNNAGSSDDIWIAEVWENDLGIKSSSTVTSAGSNSDIGYALVVDTAAGAALVAGVMTAATQDGWVGLFNVSAASATPPAAPSAFAGSASSTTSVQWSWTDNSSDETGFRVKLGGSNLSGDLAANTTSWLQTGLTPNATSGLLLVQAFNSSGTADSSSLQRYSLADPPNSISATFFGSSVTLTWPTLTNPPSTRWSVERGSDGVNYSQLSLSSVTASYTDIGLSAATTYYYRIRAANQDGVYSSHANASAIVFTGSNPPTAPSAFNGVPQSTSTVLWTWLDNSANETGFRVLRGTVNYSGNLAANTTSWLETGLAVNSAGGSLTLQVYGSSGTANSSTTWTRYSLAEAPTAFSTTAVHVTSASFSWNTGANPLGGQTSFHVYRSTTGLWTPIVVNAGVFSTMTLTDLTAATTYFFRIRAQNFDGYYTAYDSTVSFVTGVVASSAPVAGTPAVTVSAVSPSSGVVGASPTVTVTGSRFISTTTLALERLNGTGSWAAGPSIYPARDFSLATRLDDGRILVAGGMNKADASIILSTTTIYDPVTSTWTIAAPMGTTRHNFALLKLNDGRVLAVGGHSAGLVYNASAEIYDPATDTWTPTGSFSLARAAADGVVLPDGRVLIAGGFDGTTRANVDLYDPTTGSWTARAPLPTPRANVALSVLNDGRVIAVGGLPAAGTSAAAEIYDPGLNTWTSASSMTISRSAHRSVVLPDGRVLVVGGSSFGLGAQSSAEIYDPVANTWTATPPMNVGRYHPAIELLGGRVFVAGGLDGSSATASVQTYDPASNTWTTMASMSTPRFQTSLVRMSDDRLMLIAGEGTASAVLSSVELLTVPLTSIAATGVTVTTSTSLSATFPLAGAATGYWDVVARGPGTGRLPGGFRVNAPRLTSLSVAPSTASLVPGGQVALTAVGTFDDASTQTYTSLVIWTSSPTSVAVISTGGVVTAMAPGTALIAASSGAVVAYATVTVTAAPPAAPSGFAGVALGSTSIRWSWTDNASDETGFRVMSGTVSLSGDLAANATSWLQTGLSSSTTYGPYFARVFNSTGTADSAASSATTNGFVPPPAAPSAFAGTAASTSSILWSWTDNASDETGFRVMSGTISLSGDLAANTTVWLQTGLSSSTSYGPYFVRVFNSTGTADSAISSATTAAIPPAPTAPTSFSGTALSPTALLWTWLDNATNETAYRVHSGTVNLSGDLAVNASSWTQTGLTPNTSYGPYFARALNSGGAADSSSATQRTLAAAPAGTTVSSFTATIATVTWSLNGNPATTTAEVHRSTDNAAFALFFSSAATFLRDASLLGCTSYYYKVRHVNGAAVATAFDATVLVRTADTVPAAPASLTAEAVAGGRISLSWVGSPTEGVTGYRLFSDGGTGAFNFGSPLAVFTSTESSYTTGVLTSSAAYRFVLRAAHRCGPVETTGVSAAAASTATLAAVRASIKNPDAGKRINGNSVTIMAELTSGTPSQVSQVRFQFRASTSAPWADIVAANVNHPNPDLQAPYFVHWNVTAVAAGSYELRAVAYDASGAPDPAPGAITVTVTAASPDITENIVGGDIQKSQALNNAVVNTVATGGGDANDPLAKIVLPPGALNSSTVTVTVEANPTITTAPPSGLTAVGSYLRIDLDNGQHELSNGQTACITMSYPSSGVDPSRLQIYSYDNVSSSWKKDFSSTVNTSSRTITGCTPHFSVFAVFAGVATTTMLDSVRVYPNPYKPNSGNPDAGKPFTAGDGTSGIIFDNLPAAVVIEIYSLSGRRVARFDTTASGGLIRWDARNTDGRDVASGGYFAVISSQGLKPSVKKLFIIR